MTRLRTVGFFCLLAAFLFLRGERPPLDAQAVLVNQAPACTSSVVVNGASAATTQLVPLAALQRVHVCGFALTGGGATTARLVTGTGVNCGTGTTDLTGPLELGDNTSVVYGTGTGMVTRTPIGNALCWTNSGAVQVSGVVTFAQF